MTTATPAASLTIDIISDVVCPWCFIGKRHLERALTQWQSESENFPVSLRWHPFQLNPDLPAEGIDRKRYLSNKFGSQQNIDSLYERIRVAGQDVGIPFNFDGILRQPQTLAAHTLIAYAQNLDFDNDTQTAISASLVEALFTVYFIDNIYISDIDELTRIAEQHGLDRDAVRNVLSDPVALQQIAEQDHRVRAQGIHGVPFIIFNSRVALSGAQPPEIMLDAMRQSLQLNAVP